MPWQLVPASTPCGAIVHGRTRYDVHRILTPGRWAAHRPLCVLRARQGSEYVVLDDGATLTAVSLSGTASPWGKAGVPRALLLRALPELAQGGPEAPDAA